MVKEINIHIGEYFGSVEPVVIKTLLGSCVAVCLFDPVTRIGGMNHIFLPGRADLKHFDAPARFGINAMELLINKIMTLGADRRRLIAKAFGGAHILPCISDENNTGRKNSDFVMAFLKNESIPLTSYRLGGNHGCHVHFHTNTGMVFVKKIPSAQIPTLCAHERKTLGRIRKTVKKPGTITIFKNNQ